MVLGVSLHLTMREADAVHAERSRLAMGSAVSAQIQQLALIADDNAYWDDAAKAVYQSPALPSFFVTTWGSGTAEAPNYDAVALVEPNGKTRLAYVNGKQVPLQMSEHLGAVLPTLQRRLSSVSPAIGGLVKTPNGIAVVGVAQVRPTTNAMRSIMPADGATMLVFLRTLSPAIVSEMGHRLILNGATIDAAKANGIALPLKDPTGRTIANLRWQSPAPGLEALKRSLPFIGIAVLVHIMLALLIAKQGLSSLRDLANQALSDGLSGLPNRRAIRARLQKALSRGEKATLAMIDLDGFKAINDNYGHATGDRLIKLAAELLSEIVGDTDAVARMGGDEFAFMTTGSEAAYKAEKIARRFLERLSQPFRIDERTVLIGASIGMATAARGEFESGELFRRADVAMYAGKRAGKMRCAWYDDQMNAAQIASHAIEMDLRDAIEADAFEIVYQPVYAAGDQQIVSVEALLRWNCPGRGEMPPEDFIPVAEETGLIDRIGMVVLRRACTDGLQWDNVRVAVNVSAAQLRNPAFSTQLATMLEEVGFPAERLEIEITETYLVYDPETAARVLAEVRALGVGVALDDFGTGYASIGFLRKFAFSKLKLDRSLVAEASESEAARTVVHASIAVARALNMEVTAEGVETADQAAMMRTVGCDQLQGWLYAAAMDASAISAEIAPASAVPRLRAV